MASKKIYQLEGVRGIGALIVLVCHFQIIIVPDFYDYFYKFLYKYFHSHTPTNLIVISSNLMINGNLVLHIFWALSAYVLFRKFFEYDIPGVVLLSASVKRYFRLMLPCAVSIFFSYIIYKAGLIYVRKLGVETLQQNLYLIPPSFLHALKTSVWSTMFNYDYYDSYNGPLWTIQREFYGSVFCFALFATVGKSYNRGLVYLTLFIIAGLLKIYWLNSFLFGYYLCDYDFTTTNGPRSSSIIKRINDFVDKHQWIVVTMVAMAFALCKVVIYKKLGWMDPVNVFLCALVIIITFRIRWISRITSWKGLVWLGKLSFGMYVLHWPIMCSFTSWMYLRSADHSNSFILLLLAITLALILVLSWVFHRFVDMKSIAFAGKAAKWIERHLAGNTAAST